MNTHTLDDTVSKEMHTNMADRNAKSRMRNLFASYLIILPTRCIELILKDIRKFAFDFVLSAISPHTLHQRLEIDLEFYVTN